MLVSSTLRSKAPSRPRSMVISSIAAWTMSLERVKSSRSLLASMLLSPPDLREERNWSCPLSEGAAEVRGRDRLDADVGLLEGGDLGPELEERRRR